MRLTLTCRQDLKNIPNLELILNKAMCYYWNYPEWIIKPINSIYWYTLDNPHYRQLLMVHILTDHPDISASFNMELDAQLILLKVLINYSNLIHNTHIQNQIEFIKKFNRPFIEFL
jgi:hypothetical protein